MSDDRLWVCVGDDEIALTARTNPDTGARVWVTDGGDQITLTGVDGALLFPPPEQPVSVRARTVQRTVDDIIARRRGRRPGARADHYGRRNVEWLRKRKGLRQR